MNLGSQNIGPVTFHRHIARREHKKNGRKRSIVIALTLTSMVDMFSLLVIFLLQAFSASPELLVVTKDVTLPTAATGNEIKDAPVLSLSNEGVYLDQKLVGTLQALQKDPEPLMAQLDMLRTQWMKSHPKESFRGEINVQAHRDLPSTTVASFMGMLPSQNYGSIQLAILVGGTTSPGVN